MEMLQDYDFVLPDELIATRALKDRSSARLLRLGLNDKAPVDDTFKNIGSYLKPGDTLVINNTKVMKARIDAYKITKGRVHILLVRPLSKNSFAALMNGRGPFLPGTKLYLKEGEISVLGKIAKEPGLYEIHSDIDLEQYATNHGNIPLPPYFHRQAEEDDESDYQTVYARSNGWGAVAAPTAGLHFSNELLNELKGQGVKILEITLNVGPGTFLPIRAEKITDHLMHSEQFFLSEETSRHLNETKKNGNRIIAVGTTSLRVLEQAARLAQEMGSDNFFPCHGSTELFIKPGFKFLAADGLITNFHLPRSTLMVLVSAVIGLKRALSCYEHAILNKYRFYSYGDACFFDMVENINE